MVARLSIGEHSSTKVDWCFLLGKHIQMLFLGKESCKLFITSKTEGKFLTLMRVFWLGRQGRNYACLQGIENVTCLQHECILFLIGFNFDYYSLVLVYDYILERSLTKHFMVKHRDEICLCFIPNLFGAILGRNSILTCRVSKL